MAIDLQQDGYRHFRSIVAERTRPIVLWIGAGLSHQAGVPLWTGLRSDLQDALSRKVSRLTGEDARRVNNALYQISKISDLWLAFEKLKTELGEASFISAVRDSLAKADSPKPPPIYDLLWQLPLRGIVTLNLDRFASRSYPTGRHPPEPFQLAGYRASTTVSNPFKQPKPFVVNLHGSLDLHETWVLTRNDFTELTKKSAYQAFVQTCFNASAVLFLGITADDIAAGGHIERLKEMGVDAGGHFWVTDRSDLKTDRWAQSAGIELITYSPSNGTHAELRDLLRDLQRYIPRDATPAPVKPHLEKTSSEMQLPSAEELRALKADEARQILNIKAVQLLSGTDSSAYINFCEENQEAIYKCWFLTDSAPNNQMLGYNLEERVETGGFGTVYKARVASTGEPVAVKVLRPEIFWNREMLQSFRRGVRSMQILTSRGVNGIVKCLNAFEIPTAVVMEWVDGPNLEQAVKIGAVSSWEELISVARRLASVVHGGHLLPERVLHRDLRPKNVMLTDYYRDTINYDVVVLDFDLSWHQGAMEQSVTAGKSFSGYLAPEQIAHREGVSTRSAAVDSFGLGMTFYFMLSKMDPLPSQHMHRDWKENLERLAFSRKFSEWSSLPSRFSRLIYFCTQDEQRKRWDPSQIVSELERLEEILRSPEKITYADLLAEEIISRLHDGDPAKYEVNRDTLTVTCTTPIGLQISLSPNEKRHEILLQISWNDTGTLERKSVGKYVLEKLPSIKHPLENGGWENVTSNYSTGALAIGASAPIGNLGKNLQVYFKGLKEAVEKLTFN